MGRKNQGQQNHDDQSEIHENYLEPIVDEPKPHESPEKGYNTKIDIQKILTRLVEKNKVSKQDMEMYLTSIGYYNKSPKDTLQDIAKKFGVSNDTLYGKNFRTAKKIRRQLEIFGYRPNAEQKNTLAEDALSTKKTESNETQDDAEEITRLREQLKEKLLEAVSSQFQGKVKPPINGRSQDRPAVKPGLWNKIKKTFWK